MANTTTDQQWTYPEVTDPVAVPQHILALTLQAERQVNKRYTTAQDRTNRLPNPAAGSECWLESTGRKYIYSGTQWEELVDPNTVTRVTSARKTNAGSLIGDPANATDLSVSFVQRANRRYKIEAFVPIAWQLSGAQAAVIVTLRTDNEIVWCRDVVARAGGAGSGESGQFDIGYAAKLLTHPAVVASNTPRVLTIWLQSTTNDKAQIDASATTEANLAVYDIGPA